MESVLIIMRARLNGFPGSFVVHGLLQLEEGLGERLISAADHLPLTPLKGVLFLVPVLCGDKCLETVFFLAKKNKKKTVRY
jgi:hypothetical protein